MEGFNLFGVGTLVIIQGLLHYFGDGPQYIMKSGSIILEVGPLLLQREVPYLAEGT